MMFRLVTAPYVPRGIIDGRFPLRGRPPYPHQFWSLPMCDSLSNRIQDVFKSLRGETRLTEETVEAALREIRMALLEADVNFKVVKAFIDRVRDKAVDKDVLKSLPPAQRVVAIVRDEMLALFGDSQGGLPATQVRP